ncbi:MAG: hypothetical protein R2795_10340 [Saprospiraceae bacterium]
MTIISRFILAIAILGWVACNPAGKLHEYAYEKPVDTTSRPIHYQEKKTYAVDGVYADNQFDGARLNGFHATGRIILPPPSVRRMNL